MNDNYEVLRKQMAEVFRMKWEGEELPQYADLLEKFTFHMLDASAEICHMADRIKAGDGTSACDLAKSLHRFFLHALPHLMAAGQIYDFVPRLFAEQDGVHSLPAGSKDSVDDN
jgi:hypothetical protein